MGNHISKLYRNFLGRHNLIVCSNKLEQSIDNIDDICMYFISSKSRLVFFPLWHAMLLQDENSRDVCHSLFYVKLGPWFTHNSCMMMEMA